MAAQTQDRVASKWDITQWFRLNYKPLVNAGTRYYRNGLIALDSAGKAIKVTATSGLKIVGWCESYDTSSDTLATDRIDVSAGAIELDISGTDPVTIADLGKEVFAEDDHTVAKTSAAGTISALGYLYDFTADGRAVVIVGLPKFLLDLIASSQSAQATEWIPLSNFLDADGDPLAKFADGASTVPGFNVADGEAFGIRWNNHATPDPIQTSWPMPMDLDDTKAGSLVILAAKVGATLADAVTFTTTMFFQTVGALYDADTDAGGVSSAMTGSAASKTVQQVTRTIAAADIPASPSVLSLTIQPTDGTLGTDDVIVLGIGVRYSKKPLTS